MSSSGRSVRAVNSAISMASRLYGERSCMGIYLSVTYASGNSRIIILCVTTGDTEKFNNTVWMLKILCREHYGYHCSIRPMNQKAWIDDKSPRFSYLRPIQYIGVMESCTTPVLSPTYLQDRFGARTCDIPNAPTVMIRRSNHFQVYWRVSPVDPFFSSWLIWKNY